MKFKVELGEIVYCNIKVYDGKNFHLIEKIVFSNPYDFERLEFNANIAEDNRYFKDINNKTKLKIINIDIIERLGYRNKSKGYTEVKANTEIRNKITGAYE